VLILLATYFIYPDSPPKNVTATVLSPHSIRITWSPPATTMIVAEYTVVYNAVESFADDGNITVANTSIELNGLEEFVTYELTVSAISSLPSDTITAKTLSDGEC